MKSIERAPDERVNWLGSLPFFAMHLLPLGALFTGVPWVAWIIMAVLYFGRMWFVTAGYHRYFAHRTYKMSRVMQFIMALGASTAVQKGPIWWAAHHRHHHKHSDQNEDIHSPKRGFWWSHMGWILCRKYDPTRTELVPDLLKYPELRWLDKYWIIPQVTMIALVFGLGLLLTGGAIVPALGIVFIGFFLSTILLSHTTYTINSLSHVFGHRRYATNDTSRNNWLLALITGGEGWHNNHHHYQGSTRQGFKWWEIDTTYYVLWVMSKLRLVSNLRKPPKRVLTSRLIKQGAPDIGSFDKYWSRAVKAMQHSGQATGEFALEKKQKLEDLYAATREKLLELAASTAPEPSA
jgi:stearoyl-CoA desaturase (Delta-9 desaturase)